MPPEVVPAPALAIVNARVWTGDPRRPWADALLVRGKRIEVVGSSAEVKKNAGSAARTLDAKGMMVTPGSVDREGEGIEADGRLLRAGSRADFVMIDRPNTSASPEELGDARVMLTVVGGQVVFDRAGLVP